MDVGQALLERKSIRAFLDKKVSKDDIEIIINHAKYAPSGTNTQPWQVAVVTGETKKQLDELLISAFNNKIERSMDYKYYPTEFNSDMKRRRLECGLQMYNTLGIRRGEIDKRLKQWGLNYSAFGAPTELFIFAPSTIEKGSFMDCGMFIQSIMLMAIEMGLATCAQAALAEYANIVKQHLGYDNSVILLCGIAIGYPDSNAIVNNYRTPREEIQNFTKFFD